MNKAHDIANEIWNDLAGHQKEFRYRPTSTGGAEIYTDGAIIKIARDARVFVDYDKNKIKNMDNIAPYKHRTLKTRKNTERVFYGRVPGSQIMSSYKKII